MSINQNFLDVNPTTTHKIMAKEHIHTLHKLDYLQKAIVVFSINVGSFSGENKQRGKYF